MPVRFQQAGAVLPRRAGVGLVVYLVYLVYSVYAVYLVYAVFPSAALRGTRCPASSSADRGRLAVPQVKNLPAAANGCARFDVSLIRNAAIVCSRRFFSGVFGVRSGHNAR